MRYLIIGSGIAGLSAALKIAESLRSDCKSTSQISSTLSTPPPSAPPITVLAKEEVSLTNSALAQGGIAAVSQSPDTFEAHIQDTLAAGGGLCQHSVVNNFVRQAPDRILDLKNWGVHFDPTIGLEGGHHFRRIFHVEDQTGFAIHQQLLKQVMENPYIQIRQHQIAIDLILNKQVDSEDLTPDRCVGAYVFDKNSGQVLTLTAEHTILATGGAGKIYLYTSNWSGATGDGLAMAYRAGARVANLEFFQFHPTCLYHPDARNFLITEALRGEGGILRNGQGEDFMKKYHDMGSLAPRDIVARSIDSEMKKSGAPCVYLDVTHLEDDFLRQRFPHIYQKCLSLGIVISKIPIPVVPAAHYLCGGVLTNKDGRTDILNLWAIGEVACSGFHGANRLASNSLLECLTMAHNCASAIDTQKEQDLHLRPLPRPRPWIHPQRTDADEMIVIRHMWEEIRNLMWNYVGIMKTNNRLQRAQQRLKLLLAEVRSYYSDMQLHSDIVELRNIAIVADLTVESALRRKESRGTHFNSNYPETKAEAKPTILRRTSRS